MKLKSLLSALILSFTLTSSFAQSIINGSFESWSTSSYSSPNGWFDSNKERFAQTGIVTVTEVAGVSGSAAKLETKKDLATGDTMGGFISNTMGDPTSGEGGVPYSQAPTSFTGKYKANMVGTDSAVLLVIFKKSGTIVSMNMFALGGTGQTTFGTFSFPISVPVTPDSVIIASASSNLISNQGVAPGSNIVYDDFAFAGPGITQPIPGGNFDTWSAFNVDKANGWDVQGPEGGVSKSTVSYGGTYAARLETMNAGGGNVWPSSIGNGKFSQGPGPQSGQPFTNLQDTLIFFYKYTTTGGDSAAVQVGTSNAGSPVGGSYVQLPAAASFTEFKIPIVSFSAPDSLFIAFTSSRYPFSQSSVGSVLIIDEVQLASAQLNTGLLSASRLGQQIESWPNPAIALLYMRNLHPGSTLEVFDLSGKSVAVHSISQSSFDLPLIDLLPGLYYYSISNAAGAQARGKFIKQ